MHQPFQISFQRAAAALGATKLANSGSFSAVRLELMPMGMWSFHLASLCLTLYSWFGFSLSRMREEAPAGKIA